MAALKTTMPCATIFIRWKGLLLLDQPWARDAFSVTAARIRAFSAASSIFSPSWKSIARLVLPSRLELKRPDGSSSAAPLEKVIFTTFLYVSPVQINPS
jgi:hypothetical protein